MLQNIGAALVVIGFGSILLGLIGMQFSFLGFLDTWGPTAGLGIKGGLGVLGAILYFAGNKPEASDAE